MNLSNEFVLKTESKEAACFEVAAKIEELRSIVLNRKQAQYIPSEAAEEFRGFSGVVQDDIGQSVKSFYEVLDSYITKWSRSLDGTEIFAWLYLKTLPDFKKDVEPSLKFLQKHFSADAVNIDKAFDELVLLQQIVREKLFVWNAEKVSCQDRWIELIKTMSDQNRPITQIALVVQYAFAIPGTSTQVERLFSIINGIWKTENGQLALSTLEAHLNVKVNSGHNCEKFFELIKNNKNLLSQVQSSEKYISDDNNQASTSAVSYDGTVDLVNKD